MYKFILALVVAVFTGGPGGAVELQPGDLVGVYNGYLWPAVSKFDKAIGDFEIISGCTKMQNPDPCNLVGSGPPTGPNPLPTQPLLDVMSLTGRKKGL